MDDANFFDNFPGFESDPSAPASAEFFRLARHMHWRPGTNVYREMKAHCFRSEFSVLFGRDPEKLQNWQALCQELEIEQGISTISQCRKVRFAAHVYSVSP